MRFLLITLGSAGDVHPFVGLALRLQQRGHCVTLMTSGYFEDLARSAGVEFEALGTREEFERITDNPTLWHPTKGFSVVAQSVLHFLPGMYEKIEQHLRHHPETILVGSSLAFAARLMQEKMGAPLVTVHLSPSTIRSAYDMMKIPGVPIGKRWPVWTKRAFFAMADWLILDRALAPGLNAFRREIGMPPVKRIVGHWWHSPQLVLGLWPEIFAAPQPDWPAHAVLTGFPLWDEIGVTPMSEELKQFLAAGPAPVAFTPGSAMMHGEEFFRKAVGACMAANVRGLLLSRHRRHLPERLPENVAHFEYAPFSQLLPRCAALVHHGGIGTTAQALATGTPQIVVPFSFDQFDNADRSRRLGVAKVIPQKRFRAKRIAVAIAEVAGASSRAAAIAGKITAVDGLDAASVQIERLMA
ncbi:MAG TPA: glycosyltransferase [Tepidisphaeraceae bacterium]|nr:glycosyltransferase [Tepidisphaeraceae bacterium]